MNKLYLNQTAIGGFTYITYWSISEIDIDYTLLQYFFDGSQYDVNKNATNHVRAVRAF
ncbi:MAG: hypothetical protein ABIT06_06000 [Saprospiraceae bacterium]